VVSRQAQAGDHPVERRASGLVRIPDHGRRVQLGGEAVATGAVVIAEEAEPEPAGRQALQAGRDLGGQRVEAPLAQRVVEVEHHGADIARLESRRIDLEDRVEMEIGRQPAQQLVEPAAYATVRHPTSLAGEGSSVEARAPATLAAAGECCDSCAAR
jgi:hypothetical protein